MTIKEQINSLIKQSKSARSVNQYIENDSLIAYVRITKRYIEGKIVDTIDIANVSVYEEYQNKGIFKEFLQLVESLAFENNKVVYIESVLNPLLIDKLTQYEYLEVQNIHPPCFQK